MGCGEVCESEFVTGYLHNGKSAQDLFVCDHKWIFFESSSACFREFYVVLLGPTPHYPRLSLSSFSLLRRLCCGKSCGRSDCHLNCLALSRLCYSPLYIESCLTLLPPSAEGHDTDTTN